MKRRLNKIKKSRGDVALEIVVTLILFVFSVACFYPLWYVLVASFSTGTHVIKNPGLLLWPDGFHLESYKLAFTHPLLMRGLYNSIKILLISLPINIVMTVLCGYFMAHKNMKLKTPIVGMLLLTMYFGGGLIPTYLNIKELGLYDSHWSLVIPGAVSIYNAIICKTAIEAVPESLSESAYLDGANDIHVLFQIIVPLIKPTLAVLVLYYGVSHWNSWFSASIYLEDPNLLPMQNVLRAILSEASGVSSETTDIGADSFAAAVKYAAIIIATVPILCVYPFLQKHFTKGVMIGAVKG